MDGSLTHPSGCYSCLPTSFAYKNTRKRDYSSDYFDNLDKIPAQISTKGMLEFEMSWDKGVGEQYQLLKTKRDLKPC